ncbi:HAD family acid phosphatase [Rhizobium sp. P28RR-XV]|uniref:5'-nucleotidase, lipoprotein e(P4) family n=1 Tax=Rhizobium sp. P28RR-XV TaxID=2726737 RepID=UPI001456E2C4|nr:HAD family acid phosphatase [Rhizobium sp. P28RR-XV]NLR85228.1 5-nucleotide phosphatase [Rhizobium sp. P28RR-XV]
MRNGFFGRRTLVTAIGLVAALPALGADLPAPSPDDNLNAVLWDQTSVEAQANALGAYTLGRIRLDEALADKSWTAAPVEQTGSFQDFPPAIILDVDDTILNTSPYQAHNITGGTSFTPQSWTQYVNAQQDKPIAGAVEFTQYAASKGVKVFYVTNRTADEEGPTVEEMKRFGFPMGDNVDTFLSAKEQPDWGSAKGTRRAFIAKNYRVLLMFGDNFGDFTDDYKGTVEERQKVFEANAAHFGHDWIAIANPTYGSFESAPYKGDYKLPPEEQRKMKQDALTPWDGK